VAREREEVRVAGRGLAQAKDQGAGRAVVLGAVRGRRGAACKRGRGRVLGPQTSPPPNAPRLASQPIRSKHRPHLAVHHRI
jgi:hypothetical protein